LLGGQYTFDPVSGNTPAGSRDLSTDRGITKRPADTDIAGNGDLIAAIEDAAADWPLAAAEIIEGNADRHAANVLPIIRVQRAGAKSLRAIAEALNARGIATARGGRWQANPRPAAA
jgi:hypothetical protein